LVATIWLNGPPGTNGTRDYESPKNMTIDEQKSIKDLTYSMYIDVNSVYESGVDYIMNVHKNNTSEIWTQETVESSPPNAKFSNPILNSFEIGDQYVTLSFDLGAINFPENIKLFFATGSHLDLDGITCKLIDTTNFVVIPPPQFPISSSPNPLELRPGEEKSVQLQINSEANVNANASIYTREMESGLISNLTSNEISILPFGNGTTTLRITALNDAAEQSYRLPLIVNISTSPTFEPKIGGTVQLDGAKSAIISKNYDLSVTVIPKLEPQEILGNFVNSWITPLSGLWTFLAGVGVVIAPLIIRMYSHKQKERKDVR
jgi:hypothetical protein